MTKRSPHCSRRSTSRGAARHAPLPVRRALTEADWRLFVTLLRFDPVYVGLFKCNLRRIADYPNLRALSHDLRDWPGVEATVDLFHIKHHYYESLKFINPTGIVPVGPEYAVSRPSLFIWVTTPISRLRESAARSRMIACMRLCSGVAPIGAS